MTPADELFLHCRAHHLPRPVLEYKFHPERRWRFDMAWPEKMVACEIEGGTWVAGRHVRGLGFRKDCEKYNEAAILGWRVLRVVSEQIHSGEATAWLVRILE